MTAAQLRAALVTVRWSQRTLAAAVGVDERQVRRWASGQYPMPQPLADWLTDLVVFHEDNLPPGRT